jgi:membrane-associated phospholipid phosphatase
VGITGAVLGDRVPPLDSWIVGHFSAGPETASATIATAISGVGTLLGLAVLLAAAACLLWRPEARSVLPRCGVLLVTCLATVALQPAFRRPGPPLTSQDWTYPSGHVTVFTALVVTAFVISLYLTRGWRVAVLASGATMLVVVSASRMTLGEHYLVDVVAAMVATIGAGLLATAAMGLPPRTAAGTGGSPQPVRG